MTATKLVKLKHDHLILETYDFRSAFSFLDFCESLKKKLKVEMEPRTIVEPLEPRRLIFGEAVSWVGWSEINGLHIMGTQTQKPVLEHIIRALNFRDMISTSRDKLRLYLPKRVELAQCLQSTR